jgi:prolipoprotein diacylglyceryltransferase
MELLVLIPSLLIFLFMLFKLSSDDHVLIRKNISLEQMFDAAFTTLWLSLLFSRIYYFLVEQKIKSNLFIAFFTTNGGLSLTGAVVTGIIVLYLVGKYKRIPLGRLYDFFTIALLFALPAGFAGIMMLHLKQPWVLAAYGISAILYLISAILFKMFLFPKLLNRTLKEGMIGVLFLFLYAVISFGITFVHAGKVMLPQITPNSIVSLALVVIGIIFTFILQRGKLKKRV